MLLGYFLAGFRYFVKRRFFRPLNRDDNLKESESELKLAS